MDKELELMPHPRLYIGPAELARLRSRPQLPYLVEAAERAAQDAARYAEMPPLEYSRDVHNAHLTRAREVQNRVWTLLARWIQTGDDTFRQAKPSEIPEILKTYD